MTSRWRLLGLVLLCCGCDEPASRPQNVPIPTAPAKADSGADDQPALTTEAAEKRLAGVVVTIPAGWEERPLASDVILAEYRLSGTAGPARLTMSSTRGGVDANLERWHTQFTRTEGDPPPQQTTVSVDGVDAVILELHGTFRDSFTSQDPQPGWCMLGAAIPTGPEATFFVKMTGPRETVLARRDEFHNLVKTARLEL